MTDSERYRHANQIAAGMWVNTWRGWRYVRDVSTDAIGWVTFTYPDGTATAHRPAELLQSREG